MNIHNYKFKNEENLVFHPIKIREDWSSWSGFLQLVHISGGDAFQHLEDSVILLSWDFEKATDEAPAHIEINAEISLKADSECRTIKILDTDLSEAEARFYDRAVSLLASRAENRAVIDDVIARLSIVEEAILKIVDEKAKKFEPTEEIYREVYFVDEREVPRNGEKIKLDDLKVRKLPLIDLVNEYIYDFFNDKYRFEVNGSDVVFLRNNRPYKTESYWSEFEADYEAMVAEIEHFHTHEFGDNEEHPPEYFDTREEAEAKRIEIFIDSFDGTLPEKEVCQSDDMDTKKRSPWTKEKELIFKFRVQGKSARQIAGIFGVNMSEIHSEGKSIGLSFSGNNRIYPRIKHKHSGKPKPHLFCKMKPLLMSFKMMIWWMSSVISTRKKGGNQCAK